MKKLILMLALSPWLSLVAYADEEQCPYEISEPIISHPQSQHYRGACLENLLYFEGQATQGVVSRTQLVAPMARDKASGRPLQVQLRKVSKADVTSQGSVPLYEVTYKGTNLCKGVKYDPQGVEELSEEARRLLEGKAIAVSGYWAGDGWKEQGRLSNNKQGPVLTLSCLSGVVAKCAHWGYVPWAVHKKTKTPLGPYHRACVQAARAMYKAEDQAVSFTCQDTEIDIYDRLGIQKKGGDKALAFESLWGEQGLRCMVRSRFKSCQQELGGLFQAAATCADPAQPGPAWAQGAAREALIAVASSPANTSTHCPSQHKPGCPSKRQP